jgi:anthranilate phosphoribosyltransferase
VIANAAFALQTLNSAIDIETAVQRATDSLLAGKGARVFKKLIEMQ